MKTRERLNITEIRADPELGKTSELRQRMALGIQRRKQKKEHGSKSKTQSESGWVSEGRGKATS
jgi:hypothetical protein